MLETILTIVIIGLYAIQLFIHPFGPNIPRYVLDNAKIENENQKIETTIKR
jgi:hypothetical protein